MLEFIEVKFVVEGCVYSHICVTYSWLFLVFIYIYYAVICCVLAVNNIIVIGGFLMRVLHHLPLEHSVQH